MVHMSRRRDARQKMQERRKMIEREIPGFPCYFATVDGRIISRKKGPARELSPRAHHRSGHLRVRLYSSDAEPKANGSRDARGERKLARYVDAYVHTLVCLTWHGPPPFDGAMVLHRDDIPTNNRPANLRWGSALENAADRDMDNERQRAAAAIAWKEFDEMLETDNAGFDWSTGEQG